MNPPDAERPRVEYDPYDETVELAAVASTPESQPVTSGESIGRASALMSAGILVSRVLGLVRSSLLLAVYGLSLAGDAFTVANTMPNYVFQLLSAGVLNAVLIPQITKAMKLPDAGQDFVDRLLTVSMVLIVAVTGIATLMTPWLISWTSDLTGSAHNLAILFGYICLPQIMFYGIYALLGQVLNARGQFAAFMWAPVLANVVQIIGLVYFLLAWRRQTNPSHWTHQMIWVLAGTTTLSIAVQGLVLLIPLYRGGFRWHPKFGVRGYGLGAASRMVGWTFAALVIAQLVGFASQKAMTAVRSRPGNHDVASVTAQANAFLLFMLPHSFITTSILTALFPQMSRAVQAADLKQMRRLLLRGLKLPAVGIIPASVAFVVLARPVVGTLFPSLSQRELRDSSEILAVMAVGTMSFGIATLQQRYCFAREDGRTNLLLQGLLSGVQLCFVVAALNVPARWAVVTIAVGQTVANTASSLAFLRVARHDLRGLRMAGVVRLYVRLGIASLFGGLLSWMMVALMGRLGHAWLAQVLTLGVAGGVYLAVFLVFARLMRIKEVDEILQPVLRRLPIGGRAG